jgi:hypothetical protein
VNGNDGEVANHPLEPSSVFTDMGIAETWTRWSCSELPTADRLEIYNCAVACARSHGPQMHICRRSRTEHMEDELHTST